MLMDTCFIKAKILGPLYAIISLFIVGENMLELVTAVLPDLRAFWCAQKFYAKVSGS